MSEQLPLFDSLPRSRPRRVLMHVSDAGDTGASAGLWAELTCRTCGHREERVGAKSAMLALRRGAPCPHCNGDAAGGRP